MKTSTSSVLIRWSADEIGRITFFNDDWAQYTGLANSDVYGSADAWIMAVHPDDRALVRMLRTAGASKLERLPVRFRLLGKDGIYRQFEGVALAVRGERDRSWAGYCELSA
jgi:PAS domain-containing protein